MPTDYSAYATKEISPTMLAFADFVLAEVFGGTLPKGLSEENFRRSISLGGSLRMQFQKSEFYRNDPRNYLANVEADRETKAAEKLARAEESARKAVERVEAARAKAEEAKADAKAKAEEAKADAKAKADAATAALAEVAEADAA